jgi:hypothetical protein
MKMPAYSLTSPRPFPSVDLRQGRPGLKLEPRTASGRFIFPLVPLLRRVSATPLRSTRCRLLSALLLLYLGLPAHAKAQVIPALKSPPRISLFGTFTDAKPDFRYWGDLAVYGFSAGGMMQSSHILGAEVRGSVLRWGGLEHQESALAGPRAALHLGRISPYISLLGGFGNAWRWSNPRLKGLPKPMLEEGLGPQGAAYAGLDLHLSHHFALRAGELGYSQIYATSHRLSQLNASAGIVYHVN